MSAADLVNVLYVAAFLGAAGYAIHRTRQEKRMFAACAERLGMLDAKHTSSSLSGTVRGLAVKVQYFGSSKSSPQRTEIEVTCAPSPVLLHLRPQDAAEITAVQKGEAIDLVTGDPALDDAWIIEGAPPERVLRVLADPSLRARLVAFREVETPNIQVQDGKLLLRRRGTEIGKDAIDTARIELAIALAEALVADAGSPLQSGDIDAARSGYRTAPRVDPDAVAAAKVAELKLLQATRTLAGLRAAAIATHCFVPAGLLIFSATRDFAPFGSLLFVLFLALVTWSILATRRAELLRAPTARWADSTKWWMIGGWAVTALILLRLFLVR